MTESRLPPLAIILSAGGLIPFFLTGLYAVRANPVADQYNPAAVLGLISYAAVILSFIGAVHWGFVIEGREEPQERSRLMLGVLPALVGWGAVMLALVAQPAASLAMLVAGFVGAAVVEQRACRRGLVPRAYMIMRWVLTIIVALVLTTVLGIRLVGGHLMF